MPDKEEAFKIRMMDLNNELEARRKLAKDPQSHGTEKEKEVIAKAGYNRPRLS
jgi:hypothetical protein